MRYVLLVLLIFVVIGGDYRLSYADSNMDQARRAMDAKNYPRAVELFTAAANAGNTEAQFTLAAMYQFGEGVPANLDQSVKWYRMAAEQGDPGAQLNLGLMYFSGKGVPLNSSEAIKWCRLSAEQGNALAQHNLAYIYASDKGDMPQDFVEAYAWWSIAEAHGIWNARFRLNDLIKQMTKDQIERAEILAQDYLVKYGPR